MRAPAPPGYEWVRIKDMEVSQYITDGCDCYPWHEVFAWWPIRTVNGRVIWWKRVFKRKVWAVWGESGFHMEPEVQYATAFDLLTFDFSKDI